MTCLSNFSLFLPILVLPITCIPVGGHFISHVYALCAHFVCALHVNVQNSLMLRLAAVTETPRQEMAPDVLRRRIEK